MNDRIKDFIEQNIDLIEAGDFEKLKSLCPPNLKATLIKILEEANITYQEPLDPNMYIAYWDAGTKEQIYTNYIKVCKLKDSSIKDENPPYHQVIFEYNNGGPVQVVFYNNKYYILDTALKQKIQQDRRNISRDQKRQQDITSGRADYLNYMKKLNKILNLKGFEFIKERGENLFEYFVREAGRLFGNYVSYFIDFDTQNKNIIYGIRESFNSIYSEKTIGILPDDITSASIIIENMINDHRKEYGI